MRGSGEGLMGGLSPARTVSGGIAGVERHGYSCRDSGGPVAWLVSEACGLGISR